MFSECPSPFSRLPQEIIDKIIDHIADDPYRYCRFVDRNIQYCALVSRSFRPRSEFHIFDALHIESTYARERKLQTLTELVRGNPKIVDYIRELSLECVDFEYSWIGEDPIFLDIMRAISMPDRPLRKLTLKADKWIDDGFGVHRFDNIAEFQPLIDNFFRPFIFPFITTLVLERIKGMPFEVVENCVNLVDLEFDHVKLVGGPSKATLGLTRPALKRLSHHRSRPPLWDTYPMDGWDAAFDLSQLQNLTVYKDKLLDLRFEQHIVDVAGASLQVLRLPTWRPEGEFYIIYLRDQRH